MPKVAFIAATAVAAAAGVALYIRHRRNPPVAAPAACPPTSAPSSTATTATAAADTPSECTVDHLASFTRLRDRLLQIRQQQQHSRKSLLLAQEAAQWSKDADAAAAVWREGKAAGHSSAAHALADMHASDDMCVTWAGGAQGWTLQTDSDCTGGRVRDDTAAARMYVLAEALGGADCRLILQQLPSCDAARQLLELTEELRSQAALTHHEAQHILGTMLLHGTLGFSQDYDAAFALFGKAAAANYAPAQSSLVSAVCI